MNFNLPSRPRHNSGLVTIRRGEVQSDSPVPALTVNDIGTPGSGNNDLSSKASTVSLPTRTTTKSCPSTQPRAPVLRKNSHTGSSNGLNSKTGSANSKATSSNVSKKEPQAQPRKVVGHDLLKGTASKSAPTAKPGSQSESKNLVQNGNHEGKQSGNQGESATGTDKHTSKDKLNGAPVKEKVNDEDNMVPNHTMNGNAEIHPLPSGPVTNFLSRENGQQNKSKTVPGGLGLCYGNSNSAPQSLQNLYQPEPSPFSSPIIALGQRCGPTCNGLHYCLQSIGHPVPNIKPSTPSPNKFSQSINGVTVNGHKELINGDGSHTVNGHHHDIFGSRNKSPRPKPTDISFQEAFGHLLKIRNVLNESGICSLEDHQHVAAIETLLLKVFSQGGGGGGGVGLGSNSKYHAVMHNGFH